MLCVCMCACVSSSHPLTLLALLFVSPSLHVFVQVTYSQNLQNDAKAKLEDLSDYMKTTSGT